jgi:hypothetical protein
VATGTVENTGEQTYEELEVQLTLLDDSDDVLGQCSTTRRVTSSRLPSTPARRGSVPTTERERELHFVDRHL